MVESFWAIPDVSNMRTPLSILREQAAALTEQTKGALVGVVETANDGDQIVVMLNIVVPALNDYRFRMLTYWQPIDLYPGVMDGPGFNGVRIEGEARFNEKVKEALSSPRARSLLGSLLAQVVEA